MKTKNLCNNSKMKTIFFNIFQIKKIYSENECIDYSVNLRLGIYIEEKLQSETFFSFFFHFYPASSIRSIRCVLGGGVKHWAKKTK